MSSTRQARFGQATRRRWLWYEQEDVHTTPLCFFSPTGAICQPGLLRNLSVKDERQFDLKRSHVA